MHIYNSEFFYYTVLGVDRDSVWDIIDGKNDSYETFRIPKRRGGYRSIACVRNPSGILYLQRRLSEHFFKDIPLPAPASGYIRGKSYKDFIAPHVGADFYMKLDLRDFFPSITEKVIMEQLGEFIEITGELERAEILNVISEICTYRGSLPQGGVLSPAVSNVVMRRLDRRIELYCQKLNVAYTRYADDLLFSSGTAFGKPLNFVENPWLKKRIAGIMKEGGFRLNHGKTKYGSGSISLNGIVVGQSVRFSRKRLRDIRKMLFLIESGINDERSLQDIVAQLQEDSFFHYTPRKGADRAEITVRFREYLSGYRCYLKDWCESSCPELHMDKMSLRRIIRRIDALLVECNF